MLCQEEMQPFTSYLPESTSQMEIVRAIHDKCAITVVYTLYHSVWMFERCSGRNLCPLGSSKTRNETQWNERNKQNSCLH